MSIFHKIVIVMLNAILLVLLWRLCHPTQPEQLVEISRSLKEQPVSFISASDYYSRQAMAKDRELADVPAKIDMLLGKNDYEGALSLLDGIERRYPLYEKAAPLREKVGKARADFIARNTRETIGHYENGELEKAFQSVAYADAGNPKVSLVLGLMHLSQGKGRESDFEAGEKALLYAAQNGVPTAFFELGRLYDPNGKAWRTSADEAALWYKKAFEAGIHEAGYELAQMLFSAKDFKGTVEWMTKAAEHDVIDAQRTLAWMYKEGRCVDRNLERAIRLYEVAANQNDVKAMLALGEIYYDKDLDVFSYSIAFEWYMKAAEAGNVRGQFMVAFMYENGLGVERNLLNAGYWYEQAAKNGSKKASEWVSRNLERIRQEERQKEKRRDFAKKAVEAWAKDKCKEAIEYAKQADQSDPRVLGILAYAYYYGGFGKGMTRNVQLAIKYARAAADGGDPWGYLVLARYYGGFPESEDGVRSSNEYIKHCLCYEKAAEGGIAEAQCKVAELCIFGRGFDDGVTTLRSKKKRLFKSSDSSLASDNPYATSIHDYEKAKYWLEKAYAQGSVNAAEMLATAYIIGYGEPGQALCGRQGINCFGSIPKNWPKAMALIEWIEQRDEIRAQRLRSIFRRQ
ncbi:MAG: sel1 repeat family protein [Victivallales bacterium]|nr:sel1 repeat family protein [Victivallales bacterium]